MQANTSIILFIVTICIALFYDGPYSSLPFLLISLIIGYTYILRMLYKKTSIDVSLIETTTKTPHVQLTFQKVRSISIQGTYHIICTHAISGEQQHCTGTFYTRQQHYAIQVPTSWQHCGHLSLTTCTITLTDPLSWCKLKKDLYNDNVVTLWPKQHVMHRDAQTNRTYSLMGQDGGRNERISAYMPGDPIRSIHWALSAKFQTLIVQKPAFAEMKQETYALYFNDIESIEQYDAFMDDCYSLVHNEACSSLMIWKDTWQIFELQSERDIVSLFDYLLQQPLERLYATSPPSDHATIIRYKGGLTA